MREHYLPILSSSIRLKQPSGGHSFTLWNITFSPSLCYHGIHYKKIFFWMRVFEPPAPQTPHTHRSSPYWFLFLIYFECRERNYTTKYSCAETCCSWPIYCLTLAICVYYLIDLNHATYAAICHQLVIIAPWIRWNMYNRSLSVLFNIVLLVLQGCQRASWWAGSGHFLDYWLHRGRRPGELFLLRGER